MILVNYRDNNVLIKLYLYRERDRKEWNHISRNGG